MLYAVSVDSPKKSKEFAEKIATDGNGALNFSILSDPTHQTIDAYGLFDPAYIGKGIEGVPHPAVYILNKKRKVVWSKVESDYKNRPTIEELRTELNKLK